MANNVNCPNCGHEFDPGGALAADIEKKYKLQYQQELQQSMNKVETEKKKLEAEQQLFEEKRKKENEIFIKKIQDEKIKMEAEVQERLQKSISQDYDNRIRLLQQEKDDNAEKLKQARQKELEFLQKEQQLKSKEEELEITLQKKLQEERQSISEQIRRQETEKNALKENEQAMRMRELEKQLEDQKKLAEEMRRKADQGSMQLQGEVQELALEEMLATAFPFDLISEVGKGIRGADCIQTVRNHVGQECGKIIYESKRTETFTADWIEKLKKDMLATGADIAVIVTKTMPKDLQQFGERNGVYICTFLEVKSLAVVLRNAILKISDARKSQENKGDKMVAMYQYLTSHEFINNMNAMREGFRSLRSMMQKEKEDFEKNWKKKEKHIEMIIQNSLHISGSVEGIAGQDLINMQLLDEEEKKKLKTDLHAQDSATVNGNTVIYSGNYDSLPADVQHIMDSVSGTLHNDSYSQNDFAVKSASYSRWALPITIALFAGTWFLLKFLNKNPFHLKLDEDSQQPADNDNAGESAGNDCLTYEGSSLGLSAEAISTILEKRFGFYSDLGADEQTRFLVRHKKFMSSKVFMIHDKTGFREMPVLVSAAAIQLSFGLQNYMLESYPYINIFPEEFVRADTNGICFLEGNVSGNSINISWKHFLEGYRMPDDGDNVGLHEMAHAYYTQNMECDEGTNSCFVKGFAAFTTAGTKAFEAEKISAMPFYSKYAQRNFQEFWAESVERFFERGGEMKNTYPDVYAAIAVLLNQSPME